MPGPITHLIVQQRLEGALRRLDTNDGMADLLGADRCSPYTGFGSMGPDFLFFSFRDLGPDAKAGQELVNFIFGVYDALEPLIEFYEQNIEPIVDDIEDAINAVDDALFQGLFQQLQTTTDMATNTALTAAAAVITANVDLFYIFYPKVQKDAPEDEWAWFDFLHYRRTGDFCRELWDLAGSDDDLRRYTLGYASHIATDVVGHPFVNSIVGGPYRTQWHRHKLVENFIDAYARNFYRDLARTKKCLQLDPEEDLYLADNIAGSYYYRLCEFPNGKMPSKLSDLLAKAMDNVYGGMPHPITLTAADIDSTYRLWLAWFTRATSIGTMRPPTPVPPPGSATTTLINDFVSGLPAPPGAGGVPAGTPSVVDILAALFAFAQYIADLIHYTTDWIINHAVDIVTLPVTEALGLVKWLIYQIQKGIYQVYDNLRWMLVLQAYLFPDAGDLLRQPFSRAYTNTAFAHQTSGGFASFFGYPHRLAPYAQFGATQVHLSYPTTPIEREHGEPMPRAWWNKWPETMIADPHPYASSIEALYDTVQPYGRSDATHPIDQKTWDTEQFGSALSFSARLISQTLGGGLHIPNFNLDGDRGYAWKTWRVTAGGTVAASDPLDVDYVDAP